MVDSSATNTRSLVRTAWYVAALQPKQCSVWGSHGVVPDCMAKQKKQKQKKICRMNRGYGSDWLIQASVEELHAALPAFEQQFGPPTPPLVSCRTTVTKNLSVIQTPDMLNF